MSAPRNRSAAAPSTDAAYERRWELSILVGPCSQEAAEEFLLAIEHKFSEHLGAAYAMRVWHENDESARGGAR